MQCRVLLLKCYQHAQEALSQRGLKLGERLLTEIERILLPSLPEEQLTEQG